MIACVAPNYNSAFTARFQDCLRDLAGRDMTIRAATGIPDTQSLTLRQLLERDRPSGIVCVSFRPRDDVYAEYRERRIPMVLVDEQVNGAPSIATDNVLGARLATEHLLDLGHREVAIITGRIGVPGDMNAVQRIRGFRDVMRDRRFVPARHLEVIEYTQPEGEECFGMLPHGCTAVFCAAGDLCAIGLVKAAKQAGRRVPEDLSVVGYDDSPVASVVRPSLTTIAQPIAEMARTAFVLVTSGRNCALADPSDLMFRPKLIRRQST